MYSSSILTRRGVKRRSQISFFSLSLFLCAPAVPGRPFSHFPSSCLCYQAPREPAEPPLILSASASRSSQRNLCPHRLTRATLPRYSSLIHLPLSTWPHPRDDNDYVHPRTCYCPPRTSASKERAQTSSSWKFLIVPNWVRMILGLWNWGRALRPHQ